MDVLALLKTCEAQDIHLTVTGEALHCDAPTGALTADIRAAIAWHKAAVIALLTPPPPGETAEAAATVLACEHAATYRRPSGVLVCLDCGQAKVPGNSTWHRQQPLSCAEGEHEPYPDTPGGQPRQCMRCPYVWDTPACDPAVHDPQCPGVGLVVMPGFGWSCPTCNRRYVVPSAKITQRDSHVVPEAPASTAPAQTALPMGSGVPHGEVPLRRRK